MRFFQNLSITVKMLIPLAILALALMAVSLVALYGLDLQRQLLSDIDDIALQKIPLVNEFIALSEQVQADVFRIAVLTYMGLPEAEILPVQERMQQGLSDLNVIYGQIQSEWTLDAEERRIVASIEEPLNEFRHQAEQAVAVVSDDPSFGVVLVRATTVPFNEFRSALSEFLNYQKAEINRAEAQAARRIGVVRMSMLVLGVGIMVVAMSGAVLVSNRLIAQPIRSMTALMGQLADGDLSLSVGDLQRHDEIGGMAQAVEVFRQNAIEKLQAQKALRASEEKFSKAFQTSNYAITITRAQDGKFIDVNDAFSTISGYSREEALADSSIGLKLWFKPEDREWVISSLMGGKKVENSEFIFRKKSGDTLIGLFTAQLMKIDGDTCVLSSINDISQKKQAEAELKAYSERLEEMVAERTQQLEEAQERLIRHERLAVLGQMAGSIGHELRNPLGVISNLVYYLKMVQLEAGEDVSDPLKSIEAEISNANKIISDLLDFSRINSVNRETVEVETLVQEALASTPAPFEVTVLVEDCGDLPPVAIDRGQIVQVLGNLLTNAIQAMPEGGDLRIAAEQQGEQVAIAVMDSGEGIPPENLEKIFEPLFTTKPTGIGLGLPLCKRLVEANGGQITVESTPGEGSAFTICLPAEG